MCGLLDAQGHATVSAFVSGRGKRPIRASSRAMFRPFRGKHPQIHPTAFIEESAQVIGDVIIGEQSSLWFNTVVRGDVFYIRIGDRTNIQDGTVVHVTNGTHATILEDEVTVGHNVTLHGCYIERGCLIGMGSIVMDGARIGSESLVAAGALVAPGTQVPPRSLVIGVPAKIKRELTAEEVAGLKVYWQNYIEYTRAYKDEEPGR
ncbi:MAG TPA: gamma carbonic anhydrase family protein [Pyrinomonadaceae bacterium]|nr:gamma carbonic anhydrase family protein [Pyrinomonadaceae bacterium]